MEPLALRRNRASLIAVAAVLAAGGVAFAVHRARVPEAPLPEPQAAAIGAPAAVPAPGNDAEAAAAPAGELAGEAPRFDVVRVQPDGSALVAGTAAPGAEVTVFADTAPLAAATADADGNFVVLFRAEPSATPQALTLGAGDRRSAETVMLLPAAPAVPAADDGGATPDTATDMAAGALPPVPDATAGATPAPEPDPAPQVAATAIVRADSVEVLPAPGSGGRVALGSISYADAGAVTLAGVGTAGSAIRAYVDDRLAKEVTVGGDGRWSVALDDVEAGLYRLRIDQIAPDGKVASRVETPFQRDLPQTPLARPAEAGPVPPGGSITVQPGNNLWTIAQTHYGSGVLYTRIFTANRDLIRDPELIYPGQIFAMPEVGAGRRDGPEPRPTE